MKLREYLDIVWRRKFVVLLIVFLGFLAVVLVGPPGEPDAGTYSGTMSLSADADEAELLLLQQLANESSAIADVVAGTLGPDFYGDSVPTSDVLRSSIGVSADTTTSVLQLDIVDQPSSEMAEQALNAYGEGLITFSSDRRRADRDQQLESLRQREISILARIDTLEAEIDRVTALQTEDERERGVDPDRVTTAQLASNLNTLTQVQQDIALLEDQPAGELTPLRRIGDPEIFAESVESSPLDGSQRMIVGLTLATILGLGLAFALHRFDGRLYNRRETETAFGLPVLAEIPRLGWRARRRRGLLTRSEASSSFAESYRLLRSGLAHSRASQLERLPIEQQTGGATILVTSVAAQVGKTTTVANLAVAAVDAGRSVLVVSGDLREPTLHEHFDISPPVGITDAISGLHKTGRPILEPFVVPTGIDGITFLGHGDLVSNPGETLAYLRPLLESVRDQYDMILVDSPPMLAGNDVSEMVSFADLVLLVSRVGRTTADEAEWAEEVAARLEAPLCGVVTIGARSALETRRKSPLRRLVAWLRRQGGERSPRSLEEARSRQLATDSYGLDASPMEPAAGGTRRSVRPPDGDSPTDGAPEPVSPSGRVAASANGAADPSSFDEAADVDGVDVEPPAMPEPPGAAADEQPAEPEAPNRPPSTTPVVDGPEAHTEAHGPAIDDMSALASRTIEVSGPPVPLAEGNGTESGFTLVEKDDDDHDADTGQPPRPMSA